MKSFLLPRTKYNPEINQPFIQAFLDKRSISTCFNGNIRFGTAKTLWSCDGVLLEHVTAKGDYFAMNSRNIKIKDFQLVGNYSFDGAVNVEIYNAKMMSKDAGSLC